MAFCVTSTLIASPRIERQSNNHVQLVSTKPKGYLAMDVSRVLQDRGMTVDIIGLHDEPLGGTISLIDLEGPPILEHIDDKEFQRLKHFLSKLPNPGMLWLTRACQIQCKEPQYASILGLMRVLRNELEIPVATLELDEWISSQALDAIHKVHQQTCNMSGFEPGDRSDSDCEFAYTQKRVYIPRLRRMSVMSELAARNETHEIRKRLEVGRKGLLNTLQWVERPKPDTLTGEEVLIKVRAAGINFKVCASFVPISFDCLRNFFNQDYSYESSRTWLFSHFLAVASRRNRHALRYPSLTVE